MRIFIFDTQGSKLKLIVPAEQIKTLSYSNSLFSDGSASFSVDENDEDILKGGIMETMQKAISFREQVFIEDEGKIVWGGSIISTKIHGQQSIFSLNGTLTDLKRVTASQSVYEGSVNEVLQQMFPQKGIELHEASNVLGDISIKTNSSDTIHSVLEKILRTVLARRKIVYEKDGLKVKKKILVRGIKGVKPEGVGKLYEDEYFSADIISRWRNNIIDFSYSADMSDPVTKAIVYYKDDNGVERKVEKELFTEFYGVYEKAFMLHFIHKKEDAESFAMNSLQPYSFSVDIKTLDNSFEIGDRVPVWFVSKTNSFVGIKDDRIKYISSPFRVNQKKVTFKNGERVVKYILGNALFPFGNSIVEIVSRNKQDTREIRSMI